MDAPVIAAVEAARRELTARLGALRPDDWERPTPCTEWNVRQLVNHVVGVHFRVTRLLLGGTRHEYVTTRDDDWLGDDHLAAWSSASRDLDSAVAGLADLDVAVDYRVPLTARELLRLTAFDTAVHCWDLSRAIGYEEQLDATVARFARSAMEELIQIPALAALFSPPVGEPPSGGSDQEILLYLAGRT